MNTPFQRIGLYQDIIDMGWHDAAARNSMLLVQPAPPGLLTEAELSIWDCQERGLSAEAIHHAVVEHFLDECSN